MENQCDDCYKRPGTIVVDKTVGPFPLADVEAFRFVYRRCRWCKARETRELRKKELKDLRYALIECRNELILRGDRDIPSINTAIKRASEALRIRYEQVSRR